MLLEAIKQFYLTYGREKTIVLAYSGGLDSHVLLHLYYQLREIYPVSLRAIHINHGLHPDAAKWALHCENICRQYQIEYLQESVKVKLSAGDSLEEAAREMRYAAFQKLMGEEELLLTAHHEDDQVETTFIQLTRGAGLKGLAAMPLFKKRHHFYHGRPLLKFSREILQQYAHHHQLCYITDDSNDNTKWTRNFIRHDVLPILKKRWPTISSTLARSARHAAEAQVLLEEFAQDNMQEMQGSQPQTLSIKQLRHISPAKQRLILRTWIQSQGHILPNERKIQSIQNNVLMAAIDRMPLVTWEKVAIRRYRDDLYLLPLLEEYHQNIHYNFNWNCRTPLSIPGIGVLTAIETMGKGLRADINQVSIRFRQGSEKIYLSGKGHCILKKVFQEWGIPPWLRDRIPLVYVNDELIGLIGYFLAPHYTAKENEIGYTLSL